MANTIEKVALIQTTLDKAMIQGAVTGFMEGNVGNLIYNGGDEVKIPMIDMDGLASYNRQSGFVDGDVFAGLPDHEDDTGSRSRLYL